VEVEWLQHLRLRRQHINNFFAGASRHRKKGEGEGQRENVRENRGTI